MVVIKMIKKKMENKNCLKFKLSMKKITKNKSTYTAGVFSGKTSTQHMFSNTTRSIGTIAASTSVISPYFNINLIGAGKINIYHTKCWNCCIKA